ncbi:zinc finger protein, putative [Candida dubliniensis CD36]|uniref:Zinc finger protein, putative n=1 Tax=Candida dubliniensis (strain CD36 / ATCC MYA-646 / CBS 7987 / NCPF 3949 / NRRL Y-17841) TaxID=573826 RepID=B9WCG4_CANDC|nr:zinc finger protein, putative [Candida dubliniensis CD36]CAX44086.1 zinc finger protein, putative [Candida dubliniensis CD36]
MSNSPNPNNPNNHHLNKSPNNLSNNKLTNMSYSQVQTTLPPQFTEYPQQAFVQQTYQQQQHQYLQAQQAFQQHQQLQLLMQQPAQQPQQQQQQQQQLQPFPSTQIPVLQQQQLQQQQQVYSQPINQNENYYIQAPRGYSSSSSNINLQQYPLNEPRQTSVPSISPEKQQSINFNSENYNYLVPSLPPLNTIGATTTSHTPQQQQQQQQQQQVYNTSPLSATYVHENSQFVVPSVDTTRSYPMTTVRGGSGGGGGGIAPPKRGRKRRHTATVHNMTPETAERNRCRICNKQFKRPSSLQTHYYSHTGEKIFKCPWDGCGRLFSVKSNMTRHYRLHERDFKRAQEREFAPSQQQQQQQHHQHQVPNIGSVSHSSAPILQPQQQQQQQQETFNTNNQNLG